MGEADFTNPIDLGPMLVASVLSASPFLETTSLSHTGAVDVGNFIALDLLVVFDAAPSKDLLSTPDVGGE